MITPPPSPPGSTVDQMQRELDAVLKDVTTSEYWQLFASPDTPSPTVLAIMREIMLEIWSYQKHVDEAVFTAAGRMGTTVEEQGLIRSMIAVQIEETGHGMLALLDHVALGGDEATARARRPSPAALALIGVVHALAEHHHPLCFLGYMYFFERFTTMMTGLTTPILARHGYPEDRLQFMRLHAEEDVRHADMLANVIAECERRYPDAARHVRYGFDGFRAIYPHPIWSSAVARATRGESV